MTMKTTKINRLACLASLLVLITTGCNRTPVNPADIETPTRGNINIGVDDAYRLLAEAELEAFMGTYKYATINAVFADEDSILRLFMADSVRLMITSRKLTANEEAFLKEKLIIARTTHIAWDALAFVVNRSNPDSDIRYTHLKAIFEGKITSWNEISRHRTGGKLKVVFDSPRSGNVRYIMKKFNLSGPLPEHCYSTNSNAEVIDYVEKHPEAIGIISVNYVSDRDDSVTHAFLKRVKVLGVTPEFDPEGDETFKPHPAYIADKSYPFVREVYAITRESIMGLGRGFIQYLANDQGQRVVLKMGMLPATMPIRLVQIEKE